VKKDLKHVKRLARGAYLSTEKGVKKDFDFLTDEKRGVKGKFCFSFTKEKRGGFNEGRNASPPKFLKKRRRGSRRLRGKMDPVLQVGGKKGIHRPL